MKFILTQSQKKVFITVKDNFQNPRKTYKQFLQYIIMRKIFLGPPGSGKGTAASRVAPKFNVPHISTGDLFRQNIKGETPIGMEAKGYMERGELVPDEVVIGMLHQRIQEDDCQEGFILDGFPRTIPQAEKLAELSKMDLVINMDVSDDIVVRRLSSRVTCKDCGEIFNLIGQIPKNEGECDKCQGGLIRRPDDEPEVIQNRLNTYKEQTQPLINFYKNQNLVRDVTCTNIDQTAEETAQSVLDVIEDFTLKVKETFGTPENN